MQIEVCGVASDLSNHLSSQMMIRGLDRSRLIGDTTSFYVLILEAFGLEMTKPGVKCQMVCFLMGTGDSNVTPFDEHYDKMKK